MMQKIQLDQIRIGDAVLGVRDDDGCEWIIINNESWWTINLRGESAERAWRDGAWLGRQWIGAAHFTLDLLAVCDGPGVVEGKVAALVAQLPLREAAPVFVATGEANFVVFARVEGQVIPARRYPYSMGVNIQFIAADPRKLTATDTGTLDWRSVETGLPASVGGLTFPLTFPFSFDATVTSGAMDVEVAGNSDALGKITLVGPVKNPIVIDNLMGTHTRFGITLGEGQELVINLDTRQVLLDGTASRRGIMAGPWPVLSPGSHRFSWSGEQGGDGALMRIEWVNANL